METLGGLSLLLLIPLSFLLLVAITVLSAVPLYFALRFLGVDGGFLKALGVNLVAGAVSLLASIALAVVGSLIPVLPQLLASFLPILILAAAVHYFYEIEIVPAVVVAVIQYLLTLVVIVGAVFAVLIPLGVGGAFLSGFFAS